MKQAPNYIKRLILKKVPQTIKAYIISTCYLLPNPDI